MAIWSVPIHLIATSKGSTGRRNVIKLWVFVGVLINMALSLQIPVQETNQIVVSNFGWNPINRKARKIENY